MSGRRSRDKGARTERAVVRLRRGRSGMYKRGADISISLLARAVEVKCRAAGFRLSERDVLIGKADREEPFVVCGCPWRPQSRR